MYATHESATALLKIRGIEAKIMNKFSWEVLCKQSAMQAFNILTEKYPYESWAVFTLGNEPHKKYFVEKRMTTEQRPDLDYVKLD